MKNETYKTIIVQAIKYAPTVLALTCSVKIWMLTMHDGDKDAWLYGVNWINWVLQVVTVGVFYCMGRYFGFCWKHRSLCRLALWGCIYYATFLISGVAKTDIRPLTMAYVILVLGVALMYKEVK